jgi:hypothetical protein
VIKWKWQKQQEQERKLKAGSNMLNHRFHGTGNVPVSTAPIYAFGLVNHGELYSHKQGIRPDGSGAELISFGSLQLNPQDIEGFSTLTQHQNPSPYQPPQIAHQRQIPTAGYGGIQAGQMIFQPLISEADLWAALNDSPAGTPIVRNQIY